MYLTWHGWQQEFSFDRIINTADELKKINKYANSFGKYSFEYVTYFGKTGIQNINLDLQAVPKNIRGILRSKIMATPTLELSEKVIT